MLFFHKKDGFQLGCLLLVMKWLAIFLLDGIEMKARENKKGNLGLIKDFAM